MNKKVSFGTRPEREISTAATADAWVNDGASNAASATPQAKEKEVTKRLTIDVSADLHRRIKVGCALQGVNIADVLRDLLEQQFPEHKSV